MCKTVEKPCTVFLTSPEEEGGSGNAPFSSALCCRACPRSHFSQCEPALLQNCKGAEYRPLFLEFYFSIRTRYHCVEQISLFHARKP